MDIYLQNTLSGKKELFTPITPGKVTMYNCGPTAYDNAHIGNLRSYVFADILRRMFEYNDYEVTQVINITDIGHLSGDGDNGDDKMVKALVRLGKPQTMTAMREVADMYFEKFKADLVALNIELPAQFPFASDHIAEDIEIIKLLDEKGFVYETSDGLYFDTAQFPEYGKLGKINSAENDKSRIGENSEKKNPRDFALWKFSSSRLSREGGNPGSVESALGFESPFGRGFPGWHIECSAMSRKFLGQPFDIHTGGIDHISIHHNNEIAQSEAAFDVPLANVWMHNAFLNTSGEKMAKSEGNFITVQTLREHNIDPLALRYLFLTARYSSPMDFSWESLEAAEKGLKSLRIIVGNLKEDSKREENFYENKHSLDIKNRVFENKRNMFKELINDNLDTPKALAFIRSVANDQEIHSLKDTAELMIEFGKILGLELGSENFQIILDVTLSNELKILAVAREKARVQKDFKKSDELRKEIESHNVVIEDTSNGPRYFKKIG